MHHTHMYSRTVRRRPRFQTYWRDVFLAAVCATNQCLALRLSVLFLRAWLIMSVPESIESSKRLGRRSESAGRFWGWSSGAGLPGLPGLQERHCEKCQRNQLVNDCGCTCVNHEHAQRWLVQKSAVQCFKHSVFILNEQMVGIAVSTEGIETTYKHMNELSRKQSAKYLVS